MKQTEGKRLSSRDQQQRSELYIKTWGISGAPNSKSQLKGKIWACKYSLYTCVRQGQRSLHRTPFRLTFLSSKSPTKAKMGMSQLQNRLRAVHGEREGSVIWTMISRSFLTHFESEIGTMHCTGHFPDWSCVPMYHTCDILTTVPVIPKQHASRPAMPIGNLQVETEIRMCENTGQSHQAVVMTTT